MEYDGRHVGLKLSCGSVGLGLLTTEAPHSHFYLEEAYLAGFGEIEAYQKVYLTILKDATKKGKHLDRYEIAPEHVTVVKDISGEVEEVLKKK
jgi:hypothetical protein